MSYRCTQCGYIFETPETLEETHGLSSPPYEQFDVCPRCQGDIEEVYPCKDCEQYFMPDELHGFYCLDCLKENCDNPKDLYEFAKDIPTDGGINAFILEVFSSVDNINEWLLLLIENINRHNSHLLQDAKNNFIEYYADDLPSWIDKNEKT